MLKGEFQVVSDGASQFLILPHLHNRLAPGILARLPSGYKTTSNGSTSGFDPKSAKGGDYRLEMEIKCRKGWFGGLNVSFLWKVKKFVPSEMVTYSVSMGNEFRDTSWLVSVLAGALLGLVIWVIALLTEGAGGISGLMVSVFFFGFIGVVLSKTVSSITYLFAGASVRGENQSIQESAHEFVRVNFESAWKEAVGIAAKEAAEMGGMRGVGGATSAPKG